MESPPSPSPPKKTGPTLIGMAILAAMIVALVVTIVVLGIRGSPKSVTEALHGEKKEYVGKWATKDTTLSAELQIEATGDISYDESSALRASRGQSGNLEADQLYIRSFEGDDIVVDPSLRIAVTKAPHLVGDHFEMTANGVDFVRAR